MGSSCAATSLGRETPAVTIPRRAILISPSFASCSEIVMTLFDLIAIPRDEIYAMFSPIILPCTLTNGPPEYPGLRRVSLITILSITSAAATGQYHPHAAPPLIDLLSLVIIPCVMLG